MKIIHLQSGEFQSVGEPSKNPNMVEKRALLVYEGDFESMDGPVKITSDHIKTLVGNYNSLMGKVKRMASGDLPLKHCPPIQTDHSVSAWDTIGRLVGVEEGEYEGKVAMYGNLRFLGKDNIERVEDGRWTHLSIGADLEKGTMTELTVTPFPAAADASLLSRVNVNKGFVQKGEIMGIKQLAKSLMKQFKLSQEDADKKAAEMAAEEEKHEKLKKHLVEEKKMSEEDAEKHLAEIDDEKKKELSAEVDEKEKKLAAEEEEKQKLAAEEEKKKEELAAKEDDKKDEKLSASEKESVTKLQAALKKFEETQAKVQLSTKRNQISIRLSKLKSQAKITPAEIKKVDIAKLSSSNQETIDAVLESYEKREPVIFAGLMGTTKAEEIAKMSKMAKQSRLEKETLANMPFLSAALKSTKLSEGAPEKVEVHVDATPHVDYEMACKMIDEGKTEDLKQHLRHLYDKLKYMGEGSGEEKEMETLAKEVAEMHNGLKDIISLAGSINGIKL